MSQDGRKKPWSAERKAAHGAKIRAALANRGSKKTSKVKRGKVFVAGPDQEALRLIANYEAAKQAIRDYFA